LVLFDSGFKGQSRVAFRGQRITPHSKKKFQYAVVLNLRLLYKSFLFVRTLFVRFPLPQRRILRRSLVQVVARS
jgi:hypothetical protein